MRNAVVIIISPGSFGLKRSLETPGLFLKSPRFFFLLLVFLEIQRQGQVGPLQVPPVRPFFNIALIYSPYLHEGNTQPDKVGRAVTGRKNPCPVFHCLHVNLNDRCIKISFFYVLYRGIASPANVYSLYPDIACSPRRSKGSGREPHRGIPVRADLSRTTTHLKITTLIFKHFFGRVGNYFSPLSPYISLAQ